MTSRKLSILVLACGGGVSHGILKALRHSGISCRVVGADIAPWKAGLYTVDTSYVSPWAKDEAFLDWLTEICRSESIDAVLCGAEPVLRVLARHKDAIEKSTGAVCMVTDYDRFMIGDDKLIGCQWLKDEGLNYPDFAASEDGREVERLVQSYGFPLLGKPRSGGSAQGVIRIESEADLNYVRTKEHYIIQELLGDEESEYTAGCFCDEKGTLRGVIVFRRFLQHGTSVFVEAGEFPEVREEAQRIASALKAHGPCNLQFRLDKGRVVCFELNIRFSGTTPIRAHFGYNEVEAALRCFVLGETDVDLPRVTEGVMMRYWNEIYADPAAYEVLKREGKLSSPGDYGLSVEDYGTP